MPIVTQSNELDKVDLLHQQVAGLLKAGQSHEAIVEVLSKEGINADYAFVIIGNVLKDTQHRKNFWFLIFGGSFCILGGIALTYYSYKIAVDHSSPYFYLFYGIPVAGLLMIVKAFTLFRK
jgi:hypothetical protein